MYIAGYNIHNKQDWGDIMKIEVGTVVGNLTVDSDSGLRKNRYTLWKCKCDCGKETIVSQTNLQNGHTKSCGCLQTESGIKNLKLREGTSISKLEATNKRLYKTNTSGFNGVYYAKKNRKWIAQISFKRKTYYLGEFDNKQEAIECRKEANRCLYDSFLEKYYSETKKKRTI